MFHKHRVCRKYGLTSRTDAFASLLSVTIIHATITTCVPRTTWYQTTTSGVKRKSSLILSGLFSFHFNCILTEPPFISFSHVRQEGVLAWTFVRCFVFTQNSTTTILTFHYLQFTIYTLAVGWWKNTRLQTEATIDKSASTRLLEVMRQSEGIDHNTTPIGAWRIALYRCVSMTKLLSGLGQSVRMNQRIGRREKHGKRRDAIPVIITKIRQHATSDWIHAKP